MKIAFIGGGNMGEAMLAAILEKKLGAAADIAVSDIKEERRAYLEKKYGVAATASNQEAAAGKDVVVLAVKPQNLAVAAGELAVSLKPAQLVLSILAGKNLNTLTRSLGHERIVRAMPNTPAQIGAGVSAWTATAGVTEKQKEQARAILGAMGREIYFDDEKYLDMATAVSGSGPAYFFLMAEAMSGAAQNIGLSPEAAGALVAETMLGAARLLKASGKAPAELRRGVTSPGGTTAAAIDVFEKGGFSGLIAEAVRAAYKRAQELGSEGRLK
jgi:pyrroline-5-carboxylate reductase